MEKQNQLHGQTTAIAWTDNSNCMEKQKQLHGQTTAIAWTDNSN
jgi:hypothetical protein